MKAESRTLDRREWWTRALTLPGFPDLESSLVGELAEYLGRSESEVADGCRSAAAELARTWRAAAPQGVGEVSEFYRRSDGYLYDLTWWHALAEDESALAGVEALEVALDIHARDILDFGSGIGSLGLLFTRHGMSVTLAEINAALNDYARRRFDRRGERAEFLDVNSHGLPEAAFDFVSAVDVLEHLPDPVNTLKSLAAALRPGGALFVHLPPEDDPSRPMHLWRDPEVMLGNLDEAGLWLQSADGSALVLRRGPAPRYALNRGLKPLSTKSGGVLLSERPLGATRLNPRALELLKLLKRERSATGLAGETDTSLAETTAFLESLADRRILVKTSPDRPVRWPSVTMVVPARNRHEETRACAESLVALDYPPDLLEVIVVDDASTPPLSEALSDLPIRVLRQETNVGQSAARNLASSAAQGEIIAFTDNDCVADSGWLRALIPHLCEPGVDVAGGRVFASPAKGGLAAFEAARSPLDMGSADGPVGTREPVAYLPTCNLAVEREALERLGGFDERMALGEDADFVWRALRSGSGVRYEPEARITHRHRTRLGELLRRRADYGSSEADLQLRHEEARRTMTVPILGVMSLTALTMPPVAWVAGFGLATLVALLLCVEVLLKLRRLRKVGVRLPVRKVSVAVLRQHGAGLYHFGANVARYYSLPLLGLSPLWPPLLAPTFALLLVPPVVDHRRLNPKLGLVSFAFLYWMELFAYQIGVWRGCFRWRTLRPLLPRPRFSR